MKILIDTVCVPVNLFIGNVNDSKVERSLCFYKGFLP